jgi:hypothetical protein
MLPMLRDLTWDIHKGSAYTVLPVNVGVGKGIDPGASWGICIISGQGVAAYWGKMKKCDHSWEYGEEAFRMGKTFSGPVVVEGAAYHKQFGQVGLAEVRFGFYLGCREEGVPVRIVPPATIRARVLGKGHGHTGLFSLYPLLNHNAADAFGCALYAALEMGHDTSKEDE